MDFVSGVHLISAALYLKNSIASNEGNKTDSMDDFCIITL